MPTPHGFPTAEESQADTAVLEAMVRRYDAPWIFKTLANAYRAYGATFPDNPDVDCRAFWNDVADLSRDAAEAMPAIYDKYGA